MQAPSRVPSESRRILLVATMRDEGPFVLEWAAYHLLIGFTDLVVCSNDCVDASPALLDRLATMAPLTHLRTRTVAGGKPQLEAYAQAEALTVVRRADWTMVLDADEFLNVHVGQGRVGDLIDTTPQATAFLVNWRLFGNSGRDAWQPGLVAERFTRAARQDDAVNLSYKTLFRHADAYGCRLMPHQPRYPRAERLRDLVYVDGGGERLPAYFFDESRDSFLQTEPGSVRWSLAQVNHYNTRSREDYLVKHSRGGGLGIAWNREESWSIFNRNDEEDLTLAGKLVSVKAVLAGWRRDDELRRLEERCHDLYRARIVALSRDARAKP